MMLPTGSQDCATNDHLDRESRFFPGRALWNIWSAGLCRCPLMKLNPEIPKTIIKSYKYAFNLIIKSDIDVRGPIFGHIKFIIVPIDNNATDLVYIKNQELRIVSDEFHKSGMYQYTIYSLYLDGTRHAHVNISFNLIGKLEMGTNIRDIYFKKMANSILFSMKLYPQSLHKLDFKFLVTCDNSTFRRLDDIIMIRIHSNMTNVYGITVDLLYRFMNYKVIGTWRPFVIFVDYKKAREKITDEDMDGSIIRSDYQVDYNDPIYRHSTYSPLLLPAIPVMPRVVVTFFPDTFNKFSILNLPNVMLFLWMVLMMVLIILTIYYAKCQHYFWVPLDREIVEIDPLDQAAGFGMCFFDFWLNLVGHDKQEQHCFLDMWTDKFGTEFPLNMCHMCIIQSSQLISENRLEELVTFDSRRNCTDNNCQFPFFQRQLQLFGDRVPGFQCLTCTKEAYIQLLKTSFEYSQNLV